MHLCGAERALASLHSCITAVNRWLQVFVFTLCCRIKFRYFSACNIDLVLLFDAFACPKCHFILIAVQLYCRLQHLPHRCTASGNTRRNAMMFNPFKGMQNAEK
jgi:predicted RNA-binding Zn-ribbon protein involved in translation (DUF1610 family)